MVTLSEQPETKPPCPNCGGDPMPDPEHRLRALGYTHDDITYTCSDCGREWTCGVPIGDPDGSTDLRCDSCFHDGDEVYGRVNWIRWQDDTRFALSVKCPRCNFVWSVTREATNGAALLRDPVIEGDTANAEDPFED